MFNNHTKENVFEAFESKYVEKPEQTGTVRRSRLGHF